MQISVRFQKIHFNRLLFIKSLSQNDERFRFWSSYRNGSHWFIKTLYTGDYNILIKKMLVPVLTDETINWYIPYLSNRNFCIETASSEKAPITYGVPQG